MTRFAGLFEGKVAVVTGGAHGIGAATAARLSAEGAHVVVADLEACEGPSLVCDVGTAEGWELVRQAVPGRVDVLVHNAFTMTRGVAHELPESGWDRTFDVTLKAAYYGLRALGPLLLESRGSIVMVASVHAVVGIAGFSPYAAAKGGMVAYTRQLAAEYGGRLRVNAVLPGPIRTRQWEADDVDESGSAAQTAAGRLGTPEEVAAAIAFLASDEASYITGAALPVDGGFTILRHA